MAACARSGKSPQLWGRGKKRERRENERLLRSSEGSASPRGFQERPANQLAVYAGDRGAQPSRDGHHAVRARGRPQAVCTQGVSAQGEKSGRTDSEGGCWGNLLMDGSVANGCIPSCFPLCILFCSGEPKRGFLGE